MWAQIKGGYVSKKQSKETYNAREEIKGKDRDAMRYLRLILRLKKEDSWTANGRNQTILGSVGPSLTAQYSVHITH